MKTSTGIIKSLPDTAPQPAGSVVDMRQRVADVCEYLAAFALRLVKWHGKYYAVRK